MTSARVFASCVCLSLGVLLTAASAGAQTPSQASVARVTQAEFKALLDQGRIVVIDVRDAGSYRAGHIPGALSMPLETLFQRLPVLKAIKKPIVAYCA